MKLKRLLKKIFLPVIRCRVCNRPLLTATDRHRGIGVACARKIAALMEEEKVGNNGEPIPNLPEDDPRGER